MTGKTCGRLLIAAAMLGVGASATQAADHHGLTGFGIGVHGGFAGIDTDGVHDFDVGGDPRVPEDLSTFDLDNGLFGGHVTYMAARGHLLFGVIADYSHLGSSDTISDGFAPPVNDTASAELDSLWSIRAKLGYSLGWVAPFVTVGYGQADFDLTINDFNGGNPLTGTQSFDEDGVVYGAGAEFALGHGLSLGVEYLRYDVGFSEFLTNPPLPDTTEGVDFVELDDIDTFRISLTYMFDSHHTVHAVDTFK